MGRLTIASGVRAAEWLQEDIRTFAESVLSLLPSGYPSYLRVLHPAYRRDVGPVRWAEIAAAKGVRPHSNMQLPSLTGTERVEHSFPGIYDAPPEHGSLAPEIASPIATVLAGATSTPDRCWFAVWDGYGALVGTRTATAPRFHLPNRSYHLLHGPADALRESMLADTPLSTWQSPNLFWPDDHAWCLASEIDLHSTYIACDEDCADALLSLSEIEAMSVDPSAGIDFASDERPPV